MDQATLVGIYLIKTVVIKVIRVPQEDIKKKYEPQKPSEGALEDRTVGNTRHIPKQKEGAA